MKIISKFAVLLSPAERRHAFLILFLIVVMAVLDVMGVASIMPFIAVLADPAIIDNNPYLSALQQWLQFQTKEQFMFFLGVMVFSLLVFSLAFKAFTTYLQIRFSMMREFSISKRLVSGYLNQPYAWFLSRNSADLGKTIVSEVQSVVSGGLMPLLTTIAQLISAVFLLALLLIVNVWLALTVSAVLGVMYGAIFLSVKSFLSRIGEERLRSNRQRFNALSEAFGAIKEVKASGMEATYVNRFAAPAKSYALRVADSQLVSLLPRYFLEATAFGGMIIVTLVLMHQTDDFSRSIPIVALYAFAGYRLLPALQQIYAGTTRLNFIKPALDALIDDLHEVGNAAPNQSQNKLDFQKEIELDNVRFAYANSSLPALDQINLTIKANSFVAFVGGTGCGKTTIVDLILGLFEPTSGSVNIDGKALEGPDMRLWQSNIGYVPQQVYLSDDTVAANIAFGVDKEDIDYSMVKSVAKIAAISSFIETELKNGYDTIVGERGARMSGGQRQRIGLARALYRNPKVLILDEATSALDNLTERSVMRSLENMKKEKTIIVIAHRLTTVEHCDAVFFIDSGRVYAQGTFDHLIATCQKFRELAYGK